MNLEPQHKNKKIIDGKKPCADCQVIFPIGEFASCGIQVSAYCRPCLNIRGRKSQEKIKAKKRFESENFAKWFAMRGK